MVVPCVLVEQTRRPLRSWPSSRGCPCYRGLTGSIELRRSLRRVSTNACESSEHFQVEGIISDPTVENCLSTLGAEARYTASVLLPVNDTTRFELPSNSASASAVKQQLQQQPRNVWYSLMHSHTGLDRLLVA